MSHPGSFLRTHNWMSLFSIKLRPELKELYIFSLLFSFAQALILVFEPVFLYQQSFSLSFIALYYALHYSIYVVLLPLGGKFGARFGLERSLTFSLPFFIAYFLVLAALPEQKDLVWLAILLLTAHKIFYWPAFHAMFAKFGDASNRGTELSWMGMLKFGVGILGPLLGGFIAMLWGFPTLFIGTSFLVLLSVIPLLKTKERYHVTEFTYSTPWKLMFSRRCRNMVIAMMGMGENLVDMVFWPLFMFIVLGSTSQLGIVTSFTVAVMTIVSFYIGEISDRLPRRYVLRLHLPFMIIGYLFKPLAGGGMQVVLTDTLNRMAFVGVTLPMTYRLYVQGREVGPLRYTVTFEMSLAIAKAITAFVLAAVFAFMLPYTGFIITFILAGLLSFLYLKL